jgi:hypothetical protein
MITHPLSFFSITCCLIPFSKSSVAIKHGIRGLLGYNIYHVFGIRVAKIQQTKPWE